MKNQKKIKNRSFLCLILFLFLTSLLSLRALKKVRIQDIKISNSELFSKEDVVNNSSLKFPVRLIFIETNFLEKELKQNLSLKNVSISRQIFPFNLVVRIETRTPLAYAEKKLNNKKIQGFVDKSGNFIAKKNADKKNLNKLTIQVFGWEEKFKNVLSQIFISQEIYKLEIIKITFSNNGFLTIEEKDLKKVLLGFNRNLINYQLQIINNLKIELKKNSFSEKIDSIDLTDPKKPKIKVFKP